MATEKPAITEKPPRQVAKLPDAREAAGNSGTKISLACNLPHGLTIDHEGRKLTIHGANHPRAIVTSSALNGTWGITHDVPEDWFDDWVATHNVRAVQNGNIIKNTANKIEAHAEATGDSVGTGAEKLDAEAAGFKAKEGVETKNEDD